MQKPPRRKWALASWLFVRCCRPGARGTLRPWYQTSRRKRGLAYGEVGYLDSDTAVTQWCSVLHIPNTSKCFGIKLVAARLEPWAFILHWNSTFHLRPLFRCEQDRHYKLTRKEPIDYKVIVPENLGTLAFQCDVKLRSATWKIENMFGAASPTQEWCVPLPKGRNVSRWTVDKSTFLFKLQMQSDVLQLRWNASIFKDRSSPQS